MQTQSEIVKEFITIETEISKVESVLADLEAHSAKLAEQIMGTFNLDAVSNMVVDGRKVYILRRQDIGIADKDGLFGWLRANGKEFFIEEKVDTRRLTSWYNDMEDQGVVIPDDLKKSLKIKESFKLKVSKGKG